MWHGIEAVRPGRPVSEIGRAIEDHAKVHRLGVVRAFIGHGIGEQFHSDLQILHYYDSRASTIMRPGMTFTIEPMIALGSWQHRMWDDDWTAVTADGKRTAQFEHTILVTDDGADVLTGGPGGRCRPPPRGTVEARHHRRRRGRGAHRRRLHVGGRSPHRGGRRRRRVGPADPGGSCQRGGVPHADGRRRRRPRRCPRRRGRGGRGRAAHVDVGRRRPGVDAPRGPPRAAGRAASGARTRELPRDARRPDQPAGGGDQVQGHPRVRRGRRSAGRRRGPRRRPP